MTRSRFAIASHVARAMFVLIALLCAAAAMPAFAQNDLSVTSITAPQSGCTLGPAENVTIRIFNFGSTLPAGTSFNVSYTINAGAPVVELITLASNLLSNSMLNYTFTTQANLSVPGSYSFAATVSLAGDVSPANNSFTGYVVTNSASAGGTVSSSPPSPTSSGTLTLSGSAGSVVQWEESDDGGLRWFVLDNQTTTQGFANLRTTTRFRARVHSGACAEALSSVATITP
jgi:hypothetical protein